MPDRLEKFRSLFPPGFPFVTEALKAGVESMTLRKSPLGIAASYNPERNEISLDPDAPWEKIALQIGKQLRLEITPAEARAYTLLHEFGHAKRRKHVLGMQHRNTLGIARSPLFLADQIDIGVEEYEAEEYAKWRFKKWRRSAQK